MPLCNKNVESRLKRLEKDANEKKKKVDLLEDVYPLENATEFEEWDKALKKYGPLREQFVNIICFIL